MTCPGRLAVAVTCLDRKNFKKIGEKQSFWGFSVKLSVQHHFRCLIWKRKSSCLFGWNFFFKYFKKI